MRRPFGRSRLLSRPAFTALSAWVVLVVGEPAVAGEPSLESAVVFNTICARCHEGECSGRLSFDLGADAANAHIRRHAGQSSDRRVRELFALLETMKAECVAPRLAVPAPADRVWSSDLLEQLSLSSGRACAVPLGKLEAGAYRLDFSFTGEPHVHAEVVTPGFERLLDTALVVEGGEASASFEVPEAVEPFLRLYADEPAALRRLALVPRPQGER